MQSISGLRLDRLADESAGIRRPHRRRHPRRQRTGRPLGPSTCCASSRPCALCCRAATGSRPWFPDGRARHLFEELGFQPVKTRDPAGQGRNQYAQQNVFHWVRGRWQICRRLASSRLPASGTKRPDRLLDPTRSAHLRVAGQTGPLRRERPRRPRSEHSRQGEPSFPTRRSSEPASS